jgi:hypothetical protein
MALSHGKFSRNPTNGKRAKQRRITRRQFLRTTAVTTGGILMADTYELNACSNTVSSKLASTNHFWYRLQPTGPYIDSQRNNKAFGFTDRAVFLSEDNAQRWSLNQPYICNTLPPAVECFMNCLLFIDRTSDVPERCRNKE